jgi:hypothetical protein
MTATIRNPPMLAAMSSDDQAFAIGLVSGFGIRIAAVEKKEQ